MKWETKEQLAKALNNGNNKKVCDIILSNEMDMQAWDMFVFGMNLNKSDDYMSLYDKLFSVKDEYIKQAGIGATLRFRYLLSKLGIIDGLMAKKEFEIGEVLSEDSDAGECRLYSDTAYSHYLCNDWKSKD